MFLTTLFCERRSNLWSKTFFEFKNGVMFSLSLGFEDRRGELRNMLGFHEVTDPLLMPLKIRLLKLKRKEMRCRHNLCLMKIQMRSLNLEKNNFAQARINVIKMKSSENGQTSTAAHAVNSPTLTIVKKRRTKWMKATLMGKVCFFLKLSDHLSLSLSL